MARAQRLQGKSNIAEALIKDALDAARSSHQEELGLDHEVEKEIERDALSLREAMRPSRDTSVHNPYHFIPVQRAEASRLQSSAALPGTATTHDRYLERSAGERVYSGRILCQLTNTTPLFIGDGKGPGCVVNPFKHGDDPALPAASLRGLISSILEATTSSALRVLSQAPYSYRMLMGDNLPALGEIVKDPSGGKNPDGTDRLLLRPLALPNFKEGARPAPEYLRLFGGHLRLKVYINGYRRVAGRGIDVDPRSFLGRTQARSHSAQNRTEFWGMRIPAQPTWEQLGRGELRLHVSRGQILGLQMPTNDPVPWEDIDPAERKHYVRGVLRILAVLDHKTEIPNGKKHEIFLPYPENDALALVPIPAPVLERFTALARQRSGQDKEQSWPLHLKGRSVSDWSQGLQPGDLVCFKAGLVNGRSEVTEVALSSIWRRAVRRSDGGLATSHDFFGGVDPNLLPLGQEARHKDGAYALTPAERLLGVVAHERAEQQEETAFALAGRLRFSAGRWSDDGRAPKEAWEPRTFFLRELSTPKPPCPALYFKPRPARAGVQQSGYIAKKDLNPAQHVPQGRKLYLHAFALDLPAEGTRGQVPPWRSQRSPIDEKRQVQICPLKSQQRFFFHVDFDNLTEGELGALCHALRPDERFHHKLGMGKSLGLGSVRIDPQALFYVDRQARYGSDALLAGPRYHHAQRTPFTTELDEWPQDHRYASERRALREAPGMQPAPPDFAALRAAFARTVHPDVSRALALLGDPAKVLRPVRTPLIEGVHGAAEEGESYRWFVANERLATEYQRSRGATDAPVSLTPLDRNSQELPTLPRLPGSVPR